MKGDFSRDSFVPQHHYRGVLMQQGRVQVDADWNEQQAIQQHLDEMTTRDVVGLCGVPEDTLDGFKLSANDKGLDIGIGRIYVDGILCENAWPTTYSTQPHRLGPPAPSVKTDLDQLKALSLVGLVPKADLDALTKEQLAGLPDRLALAYLDVWERTITALDDAHIREKALNGPDTATRKQVIWQVRLLPFPQPKGKLDPTKQQALVDMLLKIAASIGQPPAKGVPTVKDLLAELDAPHGCRGEWPGWPELVAGSTGSMMAKAQPPSGDENNPCLVPAGGGFRRLENQLYRVEIHNGGTVEDKKPIVVTFKWSRENGSVAVRWIGQSGAQNEILEIEGPNPDTVLGFAPGQWVELTDDRRELEGLPGVLVRLGAPDGARLTVDTTALPANTEVPKLTEFPNNAKIRRWDTNQLADTANPVRALSIDKPIELEDGVQVQFKPGTYRTGDYWLIPARTTGGQIEWPGRQDDEIYWPPYPAGVDASFEPAAGIEHHYCPLAVIAAEHAGKLHVIDDCRNIFPPLTGLIDMYYAGGDGQIARADPAGVGLFLPLDLPLRVQVLGSTDPVEGAEIRFRALDGGDLKAKRADLSTTPPAQAADIILTTGPDGVAECFWKLFDGDPTQRVRASLVSVPGDKRLIPRSIVFNAQLGKASEIAYYPNAGCTNLASAHTVEDALDRLATLAHLAYIGGAGQVGLLLPNQGGTHIALARPIQVQVVSSCGPLAGAEVTFTATKGGQLAEKLPFPSPAPETLTVTTQANGIASCFWRISTSAQAGTQFVTARLTDVPRGYSPTEPQAVEFNASLIVVSEGSGGGCCVTVAPEQMSEVIQSLAGAGQQNIEVCLEVTKNGGIVGPLDLDGSDLHYSLTVRGCGKAIPVRWERWILSRLNLFHLQDVFLEGTDPPTFILKDCREVVIAGCRLDNSPGRQEPIVHIEGGTLVQVRKNVFRARSSDNPIGPRDILEGLTAIPLGDVFLGRAAEKRIQRSKASEALAGLAVTQRRRFVADLKRRLETEQARLTKTEIAAYNALANVMSPPQVSLGSVDRSLAAIDAIAAAAAKGFGPALALNCPSAQVHVVDNLIAGTLFLYSGPAAIFLNIDFHKLLSTQLKRGNLLLLPEDGHLHICGNDISRLDGAGEHAARLAEAAGNGGQIDNIFSAIFISENRLYTDPQDIVTLALAGHVVFSGNSFDAAAGNQGGSVFAISASYTGNTAPPALIQDPTPGVDLIDVSVGNDRGTNASANPGVRIVNM